MATVVIRVGIVNQRVESLLDDDAHTESMAYRSSRSEKHKAELRNHFNHGLTLPPRHSLAAKFFFWGPFLRFWWQHLVASPGFRSAGWRLSVS